MAYAYNGARVSGQTRMRVTSSPNFKIRREGEGTVISGKQIFSDEGVFTDPVIYG
jgi:hypothetical protein